MPTAFLLSLIPILSAFATSGSLEGAFATLTVSQWATLGIQGIAAGPAAIQAIEALGKAIHPVVVDFANDLKADEPDAWAAARKLHANIPATIPGYAADGSVTDIANPDLKEGA